MADLSERQVAKMGAWRRVPLAAILCGVAFQQPLTESMSDDERPAKIPRTLKERSEGRRLIVILEEARLETIKSGDRFELLNSDDHRPQILKKSKKDPSEFRPDISHQVWYIIFTAMEG